jgi:hypothetical protein
MYFIRLGVNSQNNTSRANPISSHGPRRSARNQGGFSFRIIYFAGSVRPPNGCSFAKLGDFLGFRFALIRYTHTEPTPRLNLDRWTAPTRRDDGAMNADKASGVLQNDFIYVATLAIMRKVRTKETAVPPASAAHARPTLGRMQLFAAQSFNRIEAGCPSRGDERSQCGYKLQEQRHGYKHRCVMSRYAKEQSRE